MEKFHYAKTAPLNFAPRAPHGLFEMLACAVEVDAVIIHDMLYFAIVSEQIIYLKFVTAL